MTSESNKISENDSINITNNNQVTAPHQFMNDQFQNPPHPINYHHNPTKAFDHNEKQQIFKKTFTQSVQNAVQNRKAAPRFEQNTKLNMKLYQHPTYYKVKDDDQNYSKTWHECLKWCAMYPKNPRSYDMLKMRQRLQRDYFHLFPLGAVPPFRQQQSLLEWVCQKRIQFAEERNINLEQQQKNCEYNFLMRKYNYDYEQLKRKLSHIPGAL